MEELKYNKKLIPDAPDTKLTELQKINEHQMLAVSKFEEDNERRKHTLQSAINTISKILNELRTIELSGESETTQEEDK
jgi:hypothetical protein